MGIAEVEAIIVGAGVIGLAIGAEIARQGGQPLVLESEAASSGISSRNSAVVHSGIYYPEESLKGKFCIEGRHLLYAHCDSHNIPYRKCGKLVVATSAPEISKIEAIARQAKSNGVEAAELIDGKKARELEPALAAVAALHVQETGIIDKDAFMSSLSAEIESGGGAILFHHKMVGGRCAAGCFELRIQTPSGPSIVKTSRLVLSAGLWSHDVAARLEGYDYSTVPPLTLAKGSYFSYSGPTVFTRLIYPAPVDGGLGTHLTLDLGGRMRFGPDVEWLETNDPERVDFNVDPARSAFFYDSIRRYWPRLPEATLLPDSSGVRPKLSQRGERPADFLFHRPQEHGIPGLVALYGIESPGLTSSLAIARHVVGLLG